MRQIAVASGKGGTGKTSIVASFASLTEAVFADCDVDAPNLHLILKPEIMERIPYKGMKVARIDEEKCTECGACQRACRFNAIENFKVMEEKCEGCKVCTLVCPVNAISMYERVTGHIYTANTRFGNFVYGLLEAGEEASGKLVAQVRQKAREVAEKKGIDLIIIDSPAGIGCPVIASIGNTDLVIIVAEPTMAAIHDMERILSVAEHFKIRAVVVVNKYDINEGMTEKIERFCKEKGIDIVGKIPFNKKFTEAMVKGLNIVEYDENIAESMRKIWNKIENKLK
ncbi:(4Fe-4S)-binding protein [Thermoplasmatales archaeon ex4484_30]|nr:MAG: (4Fe-4S)-binding protein [Thermoplasmata archaeon]OYT58813.1 MAG: (4Fe-4S)-binding protein [Thermoplasmatales archaeon ex4484_30]